MRYIQFKTRILTIWVVIAISVGALNVPAMGSEFAAASRFVVERRGVSDGRPVIFIPGLASAGAVWHTAAAGIASDYDLHIITFAGFAGIPAVEPIGPFIERAVAALATYLDAEGLQDAVLVGHSLGAQIALQLAVERPEAVSAVLVVDSVPFFAALFDPNVTPEAAARYGARMGAQMAAASAQQFRAFSRQGIAVQSITLSGQEQVLAYLETSDQATVARAMGDVAGADFRPVLAKVRVPVTVLAAWSEGNPYSSHQLRAIYEGQYAGLADVVVRIIANSHHFIMLDQAGAFSDALRDVLTGVRSGSNL